jgi:hypothetical protein
MALYWTLTHNGTEKTFSAWGIGSDVRLQRVNQAPDQLTFSVPGDMDGALLFAYGDPVLIQRNRSSSTGATNTFSAGSVWFRGKATLPQRSGSGSAESVQYQINGPWWDFERCVFQQTWNVWSGYVTPGNPASGNTFTAVTSSELFLGQTAQGVPQTTGAQITEAVNWAITCGAGVQLGTIDAATNIVSYNVRDITVAEVIQQMLRWSPDIILWFDYTTNPPTLHARKLSNLTAVAVDPGVEKLRQINLRPRNDLQLPSVHIRFKSTNTVDGASWTTFTQQLYPVGATGRELGASVHTIELAGMARNTVMGHLETATIQAQSANADTRKAWWQKKAPLLTSSKLANVAVESATVVDESGNTVSLSTYPREIIDGQVAEWMDVDVVPVTIRALVSYDRYADDAHTASKLLEKVRNKEVSVRVNATNGTTGDYSAVSSEVAAEAEPAGLAQSIYASHSVLQYEGSLSLVDDEIPAGLSMGKKLTINGMGQTWTNLLIQSVVEEPFHGRIALQVGPASQLGISDLIELLRVNRSRRIYNMPQQRSGGSSGGTGTVTLGQQTARENTVQGLGDREVDTLSADAGSGTLHTVQMDSKGDTFPGATPGYGVVGIYKKTALGAVDTSVARCIIDLAALLGANKELILREWDVCVDDGNGGTLPKKAWFLSTAPEDPPAP